MEDNKIRLKTNCRIVPGPSIHLSLTQDGGLAIGNTGSGSMWSHMLTMDQDDKHLVPLEQDVDGPYYRDHWPACVAFCYGKVGPINKFLRQGGGTQRWLPVPRLHARPVIYAIMDTIAKAPASRDSKADPRTPYDISNMGASVSSQRGFCKTLKGLLDDDTLAEPLLESLWEGRNLLEHALRVRLFDVAQVLWDSGMRFGKGNLDDGLVFKDLANPSIAQDLGVGLYCVAKNIVIPKANKDGRGYETQSGEIYCDLVGVWLERFSKEGGSWPKGVQNFSYRSGDTPQTIEGDLLCIPLALMPDIFTVDGQTPEKWPEWIKDLWRGVWEKAALEYAPAEMINSSVHTMSGAFADDMSMGAWLRAKNHETLAARLEKNSMQATTPSEGLETMNKAGRF